MDVGVATAAGVALAAGFNAWAAALVFGLLARVFPGLLWGTMAQRFSSGPAIVVASAFFVSEFFADKIPFLDHFWNFAHTFLRPIVGAALAIACVPAHTTAARVGIAFLGAAVTFLAHVAKTTSRFTSTAAISGWSQVSLSIAEDGIAVCVALVAVFSPTLSAGVVVAVVLLLAILYSRVRHAVGVLFFTAVHPRLAIRLARHNSDSGSPGAP